MLANRFRVRCRVAEVYGGSCSFVTAMFQCFLFFIILFRKMKENFFGGEIFDQEFFFRVFFFRNFFWGIFLGKFFLGKLFLGNIFW